MPPAPVNVRRSRCLLDCDAEEIGQGRKEDTNSDPSVRPSVFMLNLSASSISPPSLEKFQLCEQTKKRAGRRPLTEKVCPADND